MIRSQRLYVPVLFAGLVCLPSAIAQDAPAPPPARPAPAPYVPKNLKVLPDNTDLRKTMRGFAGALGVECEFCHAVNPATHRPDFPSDANPMKDTARYMIRMVDDINGKYLAQIPNREDTNPVTCGTCHRGEKHPSVFVPPPRQQGNRPPATPPPAAAPAN